MEDFEIKNVGVRGLDEITYSGYPLKHADIPIEYYSFKTGGQPEAIDLFGSEFPFTIYDEYVYDTENSILFIGSGNDYPQGIYRYYILSGDIELVYNGTDSHDAHINNFLLQKWHATSCFMDDSPPIQTVPWIRLKTGSAISASAP